MDLPYIADDHHDFAQLISVRELELSFDFQCHTDVRADLLALIFPNVRVLVLYWKNDLCVDCDYCFG